MSKEKEEARKKMLKIFKEIEKAEKMKAYEMYHEAISESGCPDISDYAVTPEYLAKIYDELYPGEGKKYLARKYTKKVDKRTGTNKVVSVKDVISSKGYKGKELNNMVDGYKYSKNMMRYNPNLNMQSKEIKDVLLKWAESLKPKPKPNEEIFENKDLKPEPKKATYIKPKPDKNIVLLNQMTPREREYHMEDIERQDLLTANPTPAINSNYDDGIDNEVSDEEFFKFNFKDPLQNMGSPEPPVKDPSQYEEKYGVNSPAPNLENQLKTLLGDNYKTKK